MKKEAKTIWEKVRDWAAFVMSAAAFLISLVVGYYTTIRKVDEVRVRVGSEPRVSPRATDDRVHVSGELSLVFINSGTRPVAVVSTILFIGRADQSTGETQCRGVALATDLDPLVIEEKKIAVKKISVRQGLFDSRLEDIRPEGSAGVSFKNEGLVRDQGYATVCLRVLLATPSKSTISSDVRLSTQLFSEDWDMSMGIHRSQPIVLWREVGTIFDSY